MIEDNRFFNNINDSFGFISNFLSEEALLKEMIDNWCIKQLGNNEKAWEISDKMFTNVRDIFYQTQ